MQAALQHAIHTIDMLQDRHFIPTLFQKSVSDTLTKILLSLILGHVNVPQFWQLIAAQKIICKASNLSHGAVIAHVLL